MGILPTAGRANRPCYRRVSARGSRSSAGCGGLRRGAGFRLSFGSGYTTNVDRPQLEGNGKPAGPALRFVAAALIVRGGEVLICQRRPDQPMGLQWEFPGGKIEPGESPEQALARELNEELGIEARIGPLVTRIRHNYRHGGAVDLQFFAVRDFAGDLENRIFAQLRWARLEDLPQYDFLPADRGLIRELASGKLL